ncbi:trypsin-like serine protease [Arthrobacter castelli]|uniref:S1 family peptidase n=1 Tax=Arthrobacter castelli TaxID=271431 RepID=UPI0009D6E785
MNDTSRSNVVHWFAIIIASLCAVAVTGCTVQSKSNIPAAGRVALVNHSAPSNDLYSGQFCGAVLVAPSLLATAAHCVETRTAKLIDAVMGADNLCKTAPVPGRRVRVTDIMVQPAPNDEIALLKTQGTSDVEPMPISRRTDSETLVVPGWGRMHDGGVPPCRVKHVQIQKVGLRKCGNYLHVLHIDDATKRLFMCAVPASKTGLNTCQGDSGSPVLKQKGGHWTVSGLTLGGKSCLSGSPGLYISSKALRSVLPNEVRPSYQPNS